MDHPSMGVFQVDKIPPKKPDRFIGQTANMASGNNKKPGFVIVILSDNENEPAPAPGKAPQAPRLGKIPQKSGVAWELLQNNKQNGLLPLSLSAESRFRFFLHTCQCKGNKL
jgi:hypothetical protein